MEAGAFDFDALRRSRGGSSMGANVFGPFKPALVARMGELGYYVNEFGIADVLMHIAITADRASQGRSLEGTTGSPISEDRRAVAEVLDALDADRDGVEEAEEQGKSLQ
mgnify:CR=1 FL=1